MRVVTVLIFANFSDFCENARKLVRAKISTDKIIGILCNNDVHDEIFFFFFWPNFNIKEMVLDQPRPHGQMSLLKKNLSRFLQERHMAVGTRLGIRHRRNDERFEKIMLACSITIRKYYFLVEMKQITVFPLINAAGVYYILQYVCMYLYL